MKNGLDEQYIDLLTDILENGVEKNTRNGKVLSVFGRTIRYKFKDGKFPLLTTKKMAWKSIVTELLWFLRGDTNIKYLVDNDCHIWDGDCYENYVKNVKQSIDQATADGILKKDESEGYSILSKESFINRIKTDDEFAKRWGELGPIYGKQWRKWEIIKTSELFNDPSDIFPGNKEVTFDYIDQIGNLINDLKTNPDSRRLMVNAWNVAEIEHMVLPPCHYGFQVYTRELSDEERLSWMKNNKSNVVLPMRDPNVTEFSMDEWFRPYGVPKRAISLIWNQRSVDTFLGLPFNIASYGLLLEIIAKEVNMVPDELIGNLGDTHLYLNHIEQAKEQIGRELSVTDRIEIAEKTYPNFDIMDFGIPFTCTHEDIDEYYPVPRRSREPYPLPKLKINLHFKNEPSFVPENWLPDDFEIVDYQSHSAIKAPLSN